MKILYLFVTSFVLFQFQGCGQIDRSVAYVTGNGQQTCVDGVLYLQFTSGVSVKYLPDGNIATCLLQK